MGSNPISSATKVLVKGRISGGWREHENPGGANGGANGDIVRLTAFR